MSNPVYRCSRCAIEYLGPDPPPSCGRCLGALYRLPDRWAGRPLDHAPRTPRLVSAFELRARRSVRRPSGDVLAPIFGGTIPSAGWLLIVTGLPGSGKSTFVLKALESGIWERPVMVVAEEGLAGVGLADRLARLEVTKTQFSDAQSFPEITSLIETADPDVLALDSATALGLTPEDCLVLRRSFPRTTVIAIVQSNKDGSHRGSQGWRHDADAFLVLLPERGWELQKCWFAEAGKRGSFSA